MKINFEINLKRHLFFLILGSTLLAGGYIYSTPYLSILGFKAAIESKDSEEARKYINFPSVRRSLKDQLQDSLTMNLSSKMTGFPLKALGMVIINPMVKAVVNSTINSTVTPEKINRLIRKGEFTNDANTKSKGNIQKKTTPNNNDNIERPELFNPESRDEVNRIELNKPNKDAKFKLYYKHHNLFVLRNNIPNIKEPIFAYWKRQGLFHWRLTSLDIPFELMRNIN